ncbi:MAG: 3-hydroxyacyl-ACP dehydratase FabZ [Bacillota bacterium]|nr:MAG: 3-hydroxyacyl-ACP dehydratase FabZ [Bacillota bacterium]
MIPHRPPFLFVDRILHLEPGRRVTAVWTPPADAGWFGGHFPGRPILPGVLQIEAMAQAGAIGVLAAEANRGKLPLFTGIERARFRRMVLPGEELRLEVNLEELGGRGGKGHARAFVDGQLAAEADLMFLFAPAPRGPTA